MVAGAACGQSLSQAQQHPRGSQISARVAPSAPRRIFCWFPRLKTSVVTVFPGQKIRLSEIDPDTGGVTTSKALERFPKLREEISLLQEKLFAEHERSLLILFQAMDTGGKDGALKALCFGLNPAGLE